LLSTRRASEDRLRLDRALNGEASDMLIEHVPVAALRRAGAFFTPGSLAEQLAQRVSESVKAGAQVLDPACGAGDLHLASARHLRVEASREATLDAWGQQLHGFDIHPEFITAAKARLVLLAVSRGARGRTLQPIDVRETFPYLQQGNFLRAHHGTL